MSYVSAMNDSRIGFHHIRARNILIATGSRPRNLPDYPADGKRILTSDHVTNLKDFPSSLCIIGAGVIGMVKGLCCTFIKTNNPCLFFMEMRHVTYLTGCEFAAIFSNFGQTRVHLVNERRKRLLPSEDPDLSKFISNGYESQGVRIHNNCKVRILCKY